jgi:hypothetical protein
MIAPVGYYEERLLSSIVSVGPEKLYLIKSTGDYSRVTDIVVDSLIKRLPQYMNKDVVSRINFTDISKIYECFVKIIIKEMEIGDVDLFIDVTSAPRLSTFAATHLGQLFDITITYTGSALDPTKIKNANKFLDERQSARDNKGIKPLHYKTHFRSIEEDEMKLLLLIRRQDYDSINELIADSEGVRKGKITIAKQRYWSRIINRLESYQLIELREINGKKKRVCITPIGRGLSLGLDTN